MYIDILNLVVLIAVMIVVLFVAAFTWERRQNKGAMLFFIYVVSGIGYALTVLGVMVAPDAATTLFWGRVRIPVQLGGVALNLLFAFEYVGAVQWLKPRRVMFLVSIPAAVSILTFLPSTADQVWRSVGIQRSAFLSYEIASERGVIYVIGLMWAYGAILLSALLFARQMIITKAPYRWQAVLLFVNSLAMLGLSAFLTLAALPPIALHLGLIGMGLRTVLIAFALFAFRLVDVMPIALRSVFDRMPIGVAVLDLKGNILQMNPIAASNSGRTSQSLIGLPLGDVFPMLGAFVERVPPHEERNEEFVYGSVPGKQRFFDAHLVPLYRRPGQLAGRVLLVMDITRSKVAELEREAMIQTLDSYAHTVAHDLKNPIGIVLGYASLMRDDADRLLPEHLKYIDTIISASQRNVSIINELLLYASIRAESQIPRFPMDMNETLKSACSRTNDYIASLECEAEIRIVTDIPNVIGYPQWVEEIWVNYLSNAVKYGGKPPVIEVGATLEGEMVRCWVRDHGDGISPEDQAALFREGERLNQHQRLQGHGLGLAICARIAKRLGGSVGVESEVGKGSTFWFTLPIATSLAASETNSPN